MEREVVSWALYAVHALVPSAAELDTGSM